MEANPRTSASPLAGRAWRQRPDILKGYMTGHDVAHAASALRHTVGSTCKGRHAHQNGIRILSAATDHLVRACAASADGFGHRHGGYLPMSAGSAVSQSALSHGIRAEIGWVRGGRRALPAVAESSPKPAGGGSVRRERRCRRLWQITVRCAGSRRWFMKSCAVQPSRAD